MPCGDNTLQDECLALEHEGDVEPTPKGSSSGIKCPESLALTGVGLARKPEHECGRCVAACLVYLLCCCRMVQIKL